MGAKIGIGVISFAHEHAGIYCRRLLAEEDVRLVACWDDDPERGLSAAKQFGMTYSPYLEDLLHHPQVQAVIVTCETNRHAEMVIAAAQAGKDILCQKPMALTLADCDRMIEAVKKAGVRFMMAYQMRHDPANIKMKEIVEAGTLGKIGLLRRRHSISVLLSLIHISEPTRPY